jgi:hypothetical protein
MAKKISVIQAHSYWRATGGTPHSIFNEATRKYEKYVEYESGQKLGPFLTLTAYKKASVDAYIHTFRVVPTM